MIAVLLFSILPVLTQCSFSINYAVNDDSQHFVSARQQVIVPANAEHVADVYARVSGLAPIFREGGFQI